MRSIGIRDLRQHASTHLRDVQRGETIEVTDRGHPVALLVPVPRAGQVARLAANGRLIEPTGDALDLGAPLAPAENTALPSATLEKARAGER